MKETAKRTTKRNSARAPREPLANHLREWGRQMLGAGKPWACVALTHMLVRTANGLWEFEQQIEHGNVPGITPSSPDTGWEDFYRRPHRMFQQVIDHSCPYPGVESLPPTDSVGTPSMPGVGTMLRMWAIEARRWKRRGDENVRRELREFVATPEGQAAVLESIKLCRELYQANLDELFGLDKEMDDATYAAGVALRPIQFFILVWIPCLIAHGESPQVLFQQAERGCRDSMAMLLQVDKRLLWCPTMARRFDEAGFHRKDGRFAEATTAIGGAPRSQSVGRYKCGVSAYILRMEQMVRAIYPRLARLTSSDIHRAFDAAARDHGFLVDEDLPASRDGYRKAVHRQRKFAHSRVWDTFSV